MYGRWNRYFGAHGFRSRLPSGWHSVLPPRSASTRPRSSISYSMCFCAVIFIHVRNLSRRTSRPVVMAAPTGRAIVRVMAVPRGMEIGRGMVALPGRATAVRTARATVAQAGRPAPSALPSRRAASPHAGPVAARRRPSPRAAADPQRAP